MPTKIREFQDSKPNNSTIFHTFASDLNAMKKPTIVFFLCLAALFWACTPKTHSLIGTWTVDKVNVQFDERRSTPGLVKQIGEMERLNIITITKDSTLIFNGLDETSQGRLNLMSDGTLLLEGVVFGQWKEEQIVTQTNSPLGEVVITYRKK